MRSKRLGKSSLKKEILFGIFVFPTHRGLKDAATDVEEFLKALTVQAEP
jgi:hypothetical protein